MSKDTKLLVAALLSTTLLTTGAAFAADAPSPDAQKVTPQATAADKDFGKVSSNAANGFQDIILTRIAIFNGQTAEAKELINKADKDFAKAKTDDTVFLKAEADLKQPDAAVLPQTATAAKAPMASKDDAAVKTPVNWVPVDASVSIDEDVTASPVKKAALADADKSLKNGDRKAALQKLTVADVSIDLALAVVPLDATISSVHNAAGLIGDGKYYEASQVLRAAEDRERIDVTTVPGSSKK